MEDAIDRHKSAGCLPALRRIEIHAGSVHGLPARQQPAQATGIVTIPVYCEQADRALPWRTVPEIVEDAIDRHKSGRGGPSINMIKIAPNAIDRNPAALRNSVDKIVELSINCDQTVIQGILPPIINSKHCQYIQVAVSIRCVIPCSSGVYRRLLNTMLKLRRRQGRGLLFCQCGKCCNMRRSKRSAPKSTVTCIIHVGKHPDHRPRCDNIHTDITLRCARDDTVAGNIADTNDTIASRRIRESRIAIVPNSRHNNDTFRNRIINRRLKRIDATLR